MAIDRSVVSKPILGNWREQGKLTRYSGRHHLQYVLSTSNGWFDLSGRTYSSISQAGRRY